MREMNFVALVMEQKVRLLRMYVCKWPERLRGGRRMSGWTSVSDCRRHRPSRRGQANAHYTAEKEGRGGGRKKSECERMRDGGEEKQ